MSSRNEHWLALDTATEIASVAVGLPARVLAARAIRGARQHAAQILPLIQQVLALATTRLEQIAGIVVGDGPGSFTGLRIGWAVARGLAQERDVPVVAVPSLLGAAHAAALREIDAGPIAACYDALRGQVFGAIYAFREGSVETVVEPAVMTVAALARIAPGRPLIVVGDGAERYTDEVMRWTGRAPVGLEALSPVASSLLALKDVAGAGRPLRDSDEPVYGRPAEAQVKWEARYGRSLPHSSS